MGGVGGQRREQPQEQRQDEIKSDPETTRDKRDPETKETQRPPESASARALERETLQG